MLNSLYHEFFPCHNVGILKLITRKKPNDGILKLANGVVDKPDAL